MACARYVERNPLRAGLEWNVDSYAYKGWLLSEEEAKEEEKIFHSSKEVIGSEWFSKRLAKIDGRLYPKGRGRPIK